MPLKALYTFGNCQRPVFSLGVSHYKHKITSPWKFGLNRSSKLRRKWWEKNTLVGRICVLLDRKKRLQVFYYFSEKLPLLKNYITSEGAISHSVLYYQQLSPLLVTKSVLKLILFVLSNYQTCTFPLKQRKHKHCQNVEHL